MFDSSWNRSHPWFWGFVLGLASTFVGILAVLAALLSGDTAAPAGPLPSLPTPTTGPTSTPEPSPAQGDILVYVGQAPEGAAELGLVAAVGDERPDIQFVRDDPDGIITGVEVLVTDPATGVSNVSSEQAIALAKGAIGNWQEVGGRDLVVTLAVIAGGIGAAAPAAEVASFEDYEGLREALVSGSGIVALVPLTEVRSPMNSIAVGRVDPVRGDAVDGAWPFLKRTGIDIRTPRAEARLEELTEALAWKPPAAIRVVGTGDTIPVRCSLAAIEATGDYGAPFRGEVGQYLAAADIALGSLDTSLQDFSEAYRCIDTTNLTSPEASVEMLQVAGFDGMTVATNHVFDCGDVGYCGSDAFLNTLKVLNEAGIVPIGGGNNLAEAQAAAIFESRGIRIGVLAFDDVAPVVLHAAEDEVGTSPLDDSYDDEVADGGGEAPFFQPAEGLQLTRFSRLISELKARDDVDFVAVLLNSGTEDTHTPSPRSIKAARAAIAAGADVVFGNQAHHVQASESIGGGFIIYAMGNLVYDQVHTPEHTEGVMTEVIFWPDRMASVRLIPIAIRDYYLPEMQDPAERGGKILNDIAEAARALVD